MPIHSRRAAMAALPMGVSAGALRAGLAGRTSPPDPTTAAAQSELAWVTAFVEAGKLPPVAECLPKEPPVYKTANLPEGHGVFGRVTRHDIGAGQAGWNFRAGQSCGWGGIDRGLVECLTRTGRLFRVSADDLQPRQNPAKSRECFEGDKTATVRLSKGATGSDGHDPRRQSGRRHATASPRHRQAGAWVPVAQDHRHPPHPAQRDVRCDRLDHAGRPGHRAPEIVPRQTRLCSEASAHLSGVMLPDASPFSIVGSHPLDPLAGGLQPSGPLRLQLAGRRPARCHRPLLRRTA